MGRNKVGSLILIQRDTLLGDYMKQSVPIDAQITFETLCSIFYPKAPLHDGAVILKDGRIVAARCVVPLKNDREIVENVGTRHRAALEASLNSDAIAVVTSEETGTISIAVDGQLIRGFTDSQLREELGKYLLSDSDKKKTPKDLFAKRKKTDTSVGEFSAENKTESAKEEKKPEKKKKEKEKAKKEKKTEKDEKFSSSENSSPVSEPELNKMTEAAAGEEHASSPEQSAAAENTAQTANAKNTAENAANSENSESSEKGKTEETADGEQTKEESGND